MRTHNWKPGKVTKVDQVKDDEGNFILDDDGTPKMKTSEVDSPFSGIVIINVPKYTERLKLQKKCNLAAKEGSIDQAALAKIGLEHITKVELVHIKSEKAITDKEELEYSKEGADVILSIANDVLGGISLGENYGQT